MKFSRLVVMVILTFALILGTGSTAFADPEWSTGGTGSGTKPGDKTNPPTGSPGSGQTSGGTSGTWSLSGVVWGNPATKTVGAPYPQSPTSLTRNFRCSGGNQWGPYLGLSWSAWGITTTDGTTDFGGYRFNEMTGSAGTCIDSPHYEIINRHCVTKISGSVTWAYGRADGLPVRTDNLGTTRTPFDTSGHTDLSKCSSAYTKKFGFKNDLWGQYNGVADAYERIATVKHYTTSNARSGVRPADVLLSLGAERKVNPVSVWWTQSCRGFETGRHDRDFTGDGCRDTPSPSRSRWTCGPEVNAWPTLSGFANSSKIEIFHDGKKRPLIFTQPKPKGNVRSIKDRAVNLEYVSGTPYREGAKQDASDQHFLAAPAYGKTVDGWSPPGSPKGKAMWTAQFFKAGLPDKASKDDRNFRAHAIFQFTADFKHEYAVVTGLTSGGDLIHSTATKWSTSSATCVTPETNLAVVRARLSN